MASELELKVRGIVRERARSRISTGRGTSAAFEADIWRYTEEALSELGETDPATVRAACEFVVADFTGLGPMQSVYDDSRVTEVMVVPSGQNPDGSFKTPTLWAEIGGRKYPMTHIDLISADDVWRIVSRIAESCGRRCDESSPLLAARLPDGSRVQVEHWAVSPLGPSVNIRKFSTDWMSAKDLMLGGAMSPAMLSFAASAVEARANIMVSGGTGSGKTTMLNALAGFIPDHERIVSLEDTLEINLPQPNKVCLQARPANAEGAGEVTLAMLFKGTLRMSPDRIIVGECRGAEAWEMLRAMQSGHDGSMTTIHASDCASAFHQIQDMVQADYGNVSAESVKSQIGGAIDLVFQTRRYRDGARRLESITAVDGYSDGQIKRMELFRYDEAAGAFRGCGLQPRKLKRKILEAGLPYDESWFFEGVA